MEAEGKHSARMNLRNDKMYSGEETDGNEFEAYSKIVFFLEILFIGHFTALLAFIWEIIWMSYHMRGPNRFVIMREYSLLNLKAIRRSHST